MPYLIGVLMSKVLVFLCLIPIFSSIAYADKSVIRTLFVDIRELAKAPKEKQDPLIQQIVAMIQRNSESFFQQSHITKVWGVEVAENFDCIVVEDRVKTIPLTAF